MATIEAKDTKQQIMEKLDELPVETLRGILTYVQFVSMDPVSRSLLTCGVEDEQLREGQLNLVEESLNDPSPRISNEQMRKELGL